MAETKRTFEQDDLFNRKPYAKFLERLILNSGSYHRDDDVQAYTIAIDSPWGTGKSVFLEKFENMLEADCPDQIRVVHYNAWKNDFWDNAFEPFADAVFSHPLFASSLGEQTNERSIKSLGNAVKHVGLAFGKKRLENYFDIEQLAKAGESLAGFVGTYTSNDPNAISPEYSAYKQNLKEMQDAMGAVLQEAIPTGKLVIVIDELDRCRPTFAIETLEIVKHIMDVKDLVFIFSLDVRQLGAAIKKVYGADTDATGYLMRFFSYYSRMPEADVEAIIARMNLASEVIPNSARVLSMIAREVGLNARDVETVGKVYALMENELLKYYKSSVAHKLYWLLLCFKYKRPIDFDRRMKGEWSNEERNMGPFIGKKSKNYGLQKSLEKLMYSAAMKAMNFDYTIGDFQNGHTIGKVCRVDCEKDIITVHADLTIENFDEAGALSGFLFRPDLKRWDEIKDLTPAQFLLQQMEMFNFIPEIPTATE